MAVNVVANVTVHGSVTYREYTLVVSRSVAKYGGWYIGRSPAVGDVEVVEGTFKPGRFDINGFESKEAALTCYNSPEYQTAADIRRLASQADTFIIDEVPAGTSYPTREWEDFR